MANRETPLPARFTLTDFEALDVHQVAGNTLTANLVALQGLHYNGQMPIAGVDGFDLPTNMVAEADVIVAGSPHGHGPRGTKYTPEASRHFKQNFIYSLQHQTRYDQTVVVTYAPQATGRLEFWADPTFPRVLLRTKAYFRNYRPRRGLNADMTTLSSADDIAVVMLVPQDRMHLLVWRGDALDVSASIVRLLGTQGKMLSLATYTAELELDIANTWFRHGMA